MGWKFIYTTDPHEGGLILASQPSGKQPRWESSIMAEASASGGTSVSVTTPSVNPLGVRFLRAMVQVEVPTNVTNDVVVEVKNTTDNRVIETITIPKETIQQITGGKINIPINITTTQDTSNKQITTTVSGTSSASTKVTVGSGGFMGGRYLPI